MSSSDLQSELANDENFQRYRSILRTVKGSLNLEKQLKEAGFLHSRRKSRKLFEIRVSPIKLQDAILEDMSNRSRLIEIKVLMLDQQELLSTAISLGKKHVRATYASVLTEYGTTKEAQLLVVEKVFSAGLKILAQIDNAVAILDLYIKDIDMAGYSLKNSVDVMKMLLDRKEVVAAV